MQREPDPPHPPGHHTLEDAAQLGHQQTREWEEWVSHLTWTLLPHVWPLPGRFARPLSLGSVAGAAARFLFPVLHSEVEGRQGTAGLSFGAMVLRLRAETPLYPHGPKVTVLS